MYRRGGRAISLVLAGALVLATLSACVETKKMILGDVVKAPAGHGILCSNKPGHPACAK